MCITDPTLCLNVNPRLQDGFGNIWNFISSRKNFTNTKDTLHTLSVVIKFQRFAKPYWKRWLLTFKQNVWAVYTFPVTARQEGKLHYNALTVNTMGLLDTIKNFVLTGGDLCDNDTGGDLCDDDILISCVCVCVCEREREWVIFYLQQVWTVWLAP